MVRRLLTIMAVMACMAACSNSGAKVNKPATDSVAETPAKTTKMAQPTDNNSVKVEVSTTMGNFTVLLFGDTPQHRDNFVKLVKDHTYDGTLFHRVINEFMVQAGDPESKTAKPGQRLGAGELGHTLPAEIVFPKHYHKRGALAAARQGDQVNPERRSSSSQFYVVTGRKYDKAQLQQMQMQQTFYALAEQHKAEIRDLQQKRDTAALMKLQNQLIADSEKAIAEGKSPMSNEMVEVYANVGGAPHLDGQYTVFGEVISGMDTIDKIEKAETDAADRPKEDIRILSMKIVD